MRVVLDTNVLVSGTFWNGDSAEIIERIDKGELELIISKELIEEYEEVIVRDEIMDKIEGKNLALNESAKKIINDAIVVEPFQKFDAVKDDSKDNKIIDCAVEGNVDYIVSQDNHLLKLKEFMGIRIVKPEEFLEILDRVNK